MKKLLLIISLFCIFSLPTFFSPARASLSSYEATFEVIANNQDVFRDVQVELTITYSTQGELTKRDMKLIEAPSIDAVEVTDGAGNPLRFKVSSDKKHSKINNRTRKNQSYDLESQMK